MPYVKTGFSLSRKLGGLTLCGVCRDDVGHYFVSERQVLNMARHRFIQLDVFTKNAFTGNPLAVFPEADGIEEALMQKIAREMNLSETVFVVTATDERALRRLRIFTPTRELPMAGHPVIGTWNLLALEGVVP